jgi:hypothetical protein
MSELLWQKDEAILEQQREIERLNKRIAELEAQLDDARGVIETTHRQGEAMAALLDRVPHETKQGHNNTGRGEQSRPEWCVGDCPACAWAKLKACE